MGIFHGGFNTEGIIFFLLREIKVNISTNAKLIFYSKYTDTTTAKYIARNFPPIFT